MKAMKKFIFVTTVLFSAISNGQATYQTDFVSPEGTFPANHGSSIVELPNGELLTCWYAGAAEKAKDVQVQCSRKSMNAQVWGDPEVAVAKGERMPRTPFKYRSLGNASLYLDSENILWLFYTPIMFFDGWSAAHVDYKTSKDFGKTWSKAKTLRTFFGNLAKNKPIKLDDNHFMIPLYHELITNTGYTAIIKHKDGKILSKHRQHIPGSKQIQPSVVWFADQTMFAYMRMAKGNNIAVKKFNFEKKKWKDAGSTNLPNPDAGVDAVKFGDMVLMVYNDSYESRSVLSLAYSHDGKNFTKIHDFENGLDCSYPAIIVSSDGNVHVTYTYDFRGAIKHVTFNREWLDNLIAAPDLN
jgi:predicted neuraminidase